VQRQSSCLQNPPLEIDSASRHTSGALHRQQQSKSVGSAVRSGHRLSITGRLASMSAMPISFAVGLLKSSRIACATVPT